MSHFSILFPSRWRGELGGGFSLHQADLDGVGESRCFHAAEVDATGKVGGVEINGVVAGFLYAIVEGLDVVTKYIEDFQG